MVQPTTNPKPRPPVPDVVWFQFGYLLSPEEKANYGRELYSAAIAGIETSMMPCFHALMAAMQLHPDSKDKTLLWMFQNSGRVVHNAIRIARKNGPIDQPLTQDQQALAAGIVINFCSALLARASENHADLATLKLTQDEFNN